MSTDLVGVIYNAQSFVVRAIIIPEAGDGLEDANLLRQQQSPQDGCEVAVINRAGLPDFSLETLITAINKDQGLELIPPEPCALVGKDGTVLAVVLADPIHTPVYNEKLVVPNKVGAGYGDKWDGADFKREYAIVNKTTGLVVSAEVVTLPDEPKTNDRQIAVVNNDQALDTGSIIGVVEI